MRLYLFNCLGKRGFSLVQSGIPWSDGAACCNSSVRRRKSSGAMCSVSVYSAFIRHPVAQAAFWKAVFIGAFLFMLRGGRSALAALCWIWSIRLHRKTLCVSIWESLCVSAGWWEGFKAMCEPSLAGYYCNCRKQSGASRLEHIGKGCRCLSVCLFVCMSEFFITAICVRTFSQHVGTNQQSQ